MNLLAIINKIIVFERRQLFGLKQIKIPVRAGLRRGVWWSCCPGAAPAGSGASRDPLCLRGHPRAASPPRHAALHNCTHGALSLVYPSWKQPRRYIFTGQQMQLGQNLQLNIGFALNTDLQRASSKMSFVTATGNKWSQNTIYTS